MSRNGERVIEVGRISDRLSNVRAGSDLKTVLMVLQVGAIVVGAAGLLIMAGKRDAALDRVVCDHDELADIVKDLASTASANAITANRNAAILAERDSDFADIRARLIHLEGMNHRP